MEQTTESIKHAIRNSNIIIPQKGDAMRELSIIENEIDILNIKIAELELDNQALRLVIIIKKEDKHLNDINKNTF